MIEKVSKLCKRLNTFTLSQVSVICEIDYPEADRILSGLISKKEITKKGDFYFYNKGETKKEQLPRLFSMYNSDLINMILNCFCSEISVMKTSLILSVSPDTVCKFNKFIRKTIYEKQKERLMTYQKKNPKVAKMRTFFEQQIYFYFFNNEFYVIDENIDGGATKTISKNKTNDFRILYSYLKRVLCHNKNKVYLVHHLAEMIWRRNKNYQVLREDLDRILKG